MKIEAKIYRLTSNNPQINKILDYNFFDYEDSFSSETFWRNVFTKKQQQGQQTPEEQAKRDVYQKFYEDELDIIIDRVKDSGMFSIEDIDIWKNIEGYTVNKQLNQVFKTQEIIFKQQTKTIIKENDLVVIKEDGKVVMIGFVASIETSMDYGEFITKSATIGDMGYLYSIVYTVAKQSLANYSLTGRDTKDLEIAVFSDNYNNLNIFQIIEKILYAYLYAAKDVDEKENTNNYFFNTSKFNLSFELSTKEKPASFAVIFVFLRLLEIYEEVVSGEEFQLAQIEHGEHIVYNKMVASQFELFRPSFKTAAAVFEDVIKQGMYNFFIDVDGKFVVRPPLYNYYGPLPEDIKDLEKALLIEGDTYILNKEYKNYIKSEEILSDKLVFDNINIKTRTDALFTWSYIGPIDWKPSFYIDINGLVKYGFRNSEPYINPNATTAELATMLAAISNIIENSMTRKLEIVVKTQDIDRFKIGETYYIDKAIQGTINKDGKETGSFGYLIDMSRNISYGNYPTTTLIFSYLRTMEMVEPKTNIGAKGNTQDLINIYKRYGVFQNIEVREITSEEFKTKSKKELKNFEDDILSKKLIPAFKVFPTILDFIRITYEDSRIIQKIKEKESENKQTGNIDLVVKGTQYKSFKVKMQKFFNVRVDDGNISSVSGNGPNFFSFTSPSVVEELNNTKIPGYTKGEYRGKANQTINHHNYNYKIYPNILNLDVWKFNTDFKPNYIKFIKQVLFNRIIECDAELKAHFEAILKEYEFGASPDIKYMLNSEQDNFVIPISTLNNNYFNISTTSLSVLENYRYKKANPLLNTILSYTVPFAYLFTGSTSFRIGEYTKIITGDYIIHPQCTLTMDMLQVNILLSKANTQEAEKIIKLTGEKKQHLIEAHKKGKAIDICVPTQNVTNIADWKAQFLFPYLEMMPLSKGSDGKSNVVNTTITYKPAFYTLLEDTLKTHFDIVKKFENIKFDISHLKLKDGTGADIIFYYADIYHLEVKNENYLQITPELLESGPAAFAITT